MTNNFLAALPQLWAIRPEALTAFVEDLRLMAADARSRDGNAAPARKPYSMDGPVAVIPVEGVLTKKGLSFFGIQLAPGMRDLVAALRRAAADRSVKAILLDVDSAGGSVVAQSGAALAVGMALEAAANEELVEIVPVFDRSAAAAASA